MPRGIYSRKHESAPVALAPKVTVTISRLSRKDVTKASFPVLEQLLMAPPRPPLEVVLSPESSEWQIIKAAIDKGQRLVITVDVTE